MRGETLCYNTGITRTWKMPQPQRTGYGRNNIKKKVIPSRETTATVTLWTTITF